MNTSSNYSNNCFICTEVAEGTSKIITKVNPDNFKKIQECASVWNQAGSNEYDKCIILCRKYQQDKWDAKFHRRCYQRLTNSCEISKLQKIIESNASSDLNIAPIPSSSKSVTTRSQVGTQEKTSDVCILCNKFTNSSNEKLHSVTTESLCILFRNIHDTTSGSALKVRLSTFKVSNDPSIGIALETKYHQSCKRTEERNLKSRETTETKDGEKTGDDYILAEMEFIAALSCALNDPDITVNMNMARDTFIRILESKHISGPSDSKSIKQLIKQKMPGIEFIKPKQKNQPELLQVSGCAVPANENKHDEFHNMLQLTTIVRKRVLDSPKWKFTGTFNNYEEDPVIYSFFKHVIAGTYEFGEEFQKYHDIEKDVAAICQHLRAIVRSNRQLRHVTRSDPRGSFRNTAETPLTVGLPLSLHSGFRSSEIVNNLSDINLSISYCKLVKLEINIANSIMKTMDDYGGYSLPSWAAKGNFTYFAIDNIDFLEHTPSGKDSLHGTLMTMLKIPNKDLVESDLVVERIAKPDKKYSFPTNYVDCEKPEVPKMVLPYTIPTNDTQEKILANNKNNCWITSALNLSTTKHEDIPTWSVFHSILCQKSPTLTNVGVVSPIFRTSPTSFSTLKTAILRAKTINDKLSSNQKTEITFDMQLFEMAMQLWLTDENIRNDFLFRPGELHTVFWALSALGSYIEGSALENAWIESGMYSATTVTKILSGRFIYRALEAHLTTVIALYSSFIEGLTSVYPEKVELLSNVLNSTYQSCKKSDDFSVFATIFQSIDQKFKEHSIHDILNVGSDDNSTHMEKFVGSYIKQVKTILNYIKATREPNINLHIQSTSDLQKYFFAHNHRHYSKMLLVYLYMMEQIRNNDPALWSQFEDGYFVVTKSSVKFTSIAPDHGCEQEIKLVKGSGGVVGVTQKPDTLDRFFTIAPTLCKLSQQFKILYNDKKKSEKHHELTGSMGKRMAKNVSNLLQIFNERDVFGRSERDSIFNIFSNEKLSQNIADDIINRDKLGQALYETFVKERLVEGAKSIFDPMEQSNIKGFLSTKLPNSTKDDKLKEQRNLFDRLVKLARTQEIDVKAALGEYEFQVIPKSLFFPDGSFLLSSDKSKIINHIEVLIGEERLKYSKLQLYQHLNCSSGLPRIILFDGMHVVNSITKKCGNISTVLDFAEIFKNRICNASVNFDHVGVAFDRYIEGSLKEQTRSKRTGSVAIEYIVKDNTSLKNVSIKNFLSHIKTKAQLTKYLSKYVINNAGIKSLLVTYEQITEGTVFVPEELKTHSHEEADTILLLHAVTAPKNAVLVVESADTDVLMWLIAHYQEIPKDTYFQTLKLKRLVKIEDAVNAISNERTDALIGFFFLTGSDMTGQMRKVTKYSSFKQFLEADSVTLNGLKQMTSCDVTAEDILLQIESFICKLHKSPCKTITDTRWFMKNVRELDCAELPPSKSALIPHIQRAQYHSIFLKNCIAPHPKEINIEDYGYKLCDSKVVPVMSTKPPAPENVLKVARCNCKTGCSSNRCSCKFGGVPCSDLCECVVFGCKNASELIEKPSIDEDFSSDDSDADDLDEMST